MKSCRRTFMFGMAPMAILRAGSATPAELLDAVAARYDALDRFSVRITSWRESDSLESGPAGKNAMRLTFLDKEHFRWESPELTIVSDGEFRWQYRAEGKEYRREAVSAPDSRILGEFNRLREQYAGRFRMVRQLAPLAKAKGEHRVPGSKLVLPFVEIAPSSGEWMEQLWVDPVENLVAGSRFSRQYTIRGRTWRVNQYQFEPNADFSAAAFAFTPPPKSKQVERFSIPSGLPEPSPAL